MKLLPLFLCAALLYSGCLLQAENYEQKMSVAFTGDIIMHIPVKNVAALHNVKDETGESKNNGGFDFLFEKITPLLTSADVAVGNMEFPVAKPYKSRPWVFNCTPDVIPAMKRAGISAVITANNHVLDQRSAGLLETMELLKNYGVSYAGTGATAAEARDGIVLSVNGINCGVLACTGISNTPIPKKNKQVFVNWFYNEEEIIADITAMKAKVDIVILVVHTGAEYVPLPNAEDRALMRGYLDAGADVIIGHHPHIVLPAEEYSASDGRETIIFYSLGNFISNQSSVVKYAGRNISTRHGLVVKINMQKLPDRNSNRQVLTANFEPIPVQTQNTRGTDGRRVIQTAPFAQGEDAPKLYMLYEKDIAQPVYVASRPRKPLRKTSLKLSEQKDQLVIKKTLERKPRHRKSDL